MKAANIQDIRGLGELEAELDRLGSYAKSKILKNGLTAAATVIAAAARRHVPVKSGKLQQAILVRNGRARAGRLSVLVAAGARWFVGELFYGAFQEFGWKTGSRKQKTGRRQIPGEHYLEYSFDETADRAWAACLEEIK